MKQEYKKVEFEIIGSDITFDVVLDAIAEYVEKSQSFSISGFKNKYNVEGTFAISCVDDVKQFGESLVKATEKGNFFVIGRIHNTFLTGITDFLIECRGASSGVENPGWCYVVSEFSTNGFETSEGVFDFPLG